MITKKATYGKPQTDDNALSQKKSVGLYYNGYNNIHQCMIDDGVAVTPEFLLSLMNCIMGFEKSELGRPMFDCILSKFNTLKVKILNNARTSSDANLLELSMAFKQCHQYLELYLLVNDNEIAKMP